MREERENGEERELDEIGGERKKY